MHLFLRHISLALALSLAAVAGHAQSTTEIVDRIAATDNTLAAQPSPLALSSVEGQALFEASKEKSAFWRTYRFFEQQETQTYCGVASSVVALNSLGLSSATPVASLGNKKVFTQSTFFTPAVEAVRAQAQVQKNGYPLAQLGDALRSHGANVETQHVIDTFGSKRLRKELRAAIQNPNAIIIINYFRPYVGQEGAGHFSLIGAYEEKSDRFLIMDVNRVNQPSIWIKTQHLYNALNTKDKDGGLNRGYLIVTK